MPKDTLESIEETVRRSNVEETEKRELLELLAKLKSEIGPLAKTNVDDAKSIVGLAEVSANEAMRERPRPEVLTPSLSALDSSVKSFEASHPDLVRVVNSISMMLSNIGI